MLSYAEVSREYFVRLDAIRGMIERPDVPVIAEMNEMLFNTVPFRRRMLEEVLKEIGAPIDTLPLVMKRLDDDRMCVGMIIYLSDGGDSPMFDAAHEAYKRGERLLEHMAASFNDLSDFITG